MELLAQLQSSESPREILLAAQQLRLLHGRALVLLPSAAEADAALATGVPHLLDILSRAASGCGEAEEVVVSGLKGALRAYERETDAEARAALARGLLASQAGVKEAFAKKGEGGGGGGS